MFVKALLASFSPHSLLTVMARPVINSRQGLMLLPWESSGSVVVAIINTFTKEKLIIEDMLFQVICTCMRICMYAFCVYTSIYLYVYLYACVLVMYVYPYDSFGSRIINFSSNSMH